jgi:hypothetical protein
VAAMCVVKWREVRGTALLAGDGQSGSGPATVAQRPPARFFFAARRN